MKLTRIDLVAILMMLAVPAAAYFGYFQHRLARLRELRQEEAELQQRSADEHGSAGDLIVARTGLHKLERRINDFVGSVSGGEDGSNRAVDAVLSSARDAGVSIDVFKPGSPVAGKALSYLPIHLTASGEFPGVYKFLLAVERGKMIMAVHTMELESDPASAKCGVKLELRIYFATPNANKGVPA